MNGAILAMDLACGGPKPLSAKDRNPFGKTGNKLYRYFQIERPNFVVFANFFRARLSAYFIIIIICTLRPVQNGLEWMEEV